MPSDEAEDWLGVALGEVADYPADVLERAARVARRSCTHHAQIVPTMVREADETMARLRAAAARPQPVTDAPRLAAPTMTQADVDSLPAKLREIGLGLGYLAQDPDGNVSLAR